jgi:hypothetical protein
MKALSEEQCKELLSILKQQEASQVRYVIARNEVQAEEKEQVYIAKQLFKMLPEILTAVSEQASPQLPLPPEVAKLN